VYNILSYTYVHLLVFSSYLINVFLEPYVIKMKEIKEYDNGRGIYTRVGETTRF
jgi:hypothetical protein